MEKIMNNYQYISDYIYNSPGWILLAVFVVVLTCYLFFYTSFKMMNKADKWFRFVVFSFTFGALVMSSLSFISLQKQVNISEVRVASETIAQAENYIKNNLNEFVSLQTEEENQNKYGAHINLADALALLNENGRHFRRLQLPYAHLQGARLQGAVLANANLQWAVLTDANLTNADLINVNFQGANLVNANLQEANLQDADLQGANLTNADLGAANLNGAYLIFTNLQGANLADADLQDSNFAGADLRAVDFRNAILRRADLSLSNLHGADFTNADMEGINFYNADLKGAVLKDADLQGTDLWDTNMQGASLRDVKMQGANLANANFENCINLTREQILDAKWVREDDIDVSPILPKYITHPDGVEDKDIAKWLASPSDPQ